MAIKTKITTVLALVMLLFSETPVFATAPTVASTTDLGVVANPNRTLLRDGGSSIELGGKLLWMFGDTIFNPASVDGVQLRSNTAGIAEAAGPYSVIEPLDANNAPYQFIPFSTTEQTYNDNATDKNRDRYIIWPNMAFNTSSTTGLVFYLRIKSTPVGATDYSWDDTRLGAAEVAANSTTASNRTDGIFAPPDDIYKPLVKNGDTVYFSSCNPNFLEWDCALAKVPFSSVLDRNAYTFWTGSAWSTDLAQASFTYKDLNTGTVAWNDYLQKYVNIYHIGFGTHLRIRTADAVTGPWSDYNEFYSNANQISTLYLHPELFTASGQNMIVTFNSDGDGIKALRITFPDASSAHEEVPGVPNTGAPKAKSWTSVVYLVLGLTIIAVICKLRLRKHNR